MVVLVPAAPEAIEQPASRPAHWELRRTEGIGSWQWRKSTESNDNERTVPEQGAQQERLPEIDEQIYNNLLQGEGWTFRETQYLLDLARQWDQRWPVISDRYCFDGPKRSLLDLQSRYYDCAKRLTGQQQFEVEGERRRRLAEESFDARPREQIEEERRLLRIATETQSRLYQLWRRRQAMIATFAGDSFLLNAPGLPDILGIGQPHVDSAEGGSSGIASSLPSAGTPQPSDKKKKAMKKRRQSEAAEALPKKAKTSSDSTRRPSSIATIQPVLRTSLLKPVRAGLSRLVDKTLLEMGLPLRPRFPSERNCELFDQIRAAIAESLDRKK